MLRFALLAMALLATSCSRGPDGLLLPAPDAIQGFLREQGLSPRGYQELLVDPSAGLVLFRVAYGEPKDCHFGCAYPAAIGLEFENRIGWIAAPEGPPQSLTRFDFLRTDSYLFDQEFLVRVRSVDGSAYDAIRLALSRDHDTPEATLDLVATMLRYDGGSPAIGRALLEHPVVRSSRRILETLVQAGGFATDWSEVHALAWALLEPFLPHPSQLTAEATVIRSSVGSFSGQVRIANPAPASAIFEYAGVCAPSLLLFTDPTYGGPPRWDELRFWNSRPGGCKWAPQILSIPPGESGRITTPAVGSDEILGDSLPSGRYYAAVRVWVLEPRDTSLLIPAGEISIVRE